MSKTAAALCFLSFAALAGCTSLTPDYVYPLGSTIALAPSQIANPDAPLESTIRTAKSGDIILQQGVQNTGYLILQNTVEAEGNISLAVQERTVDLKEGMVFYPAFNVGVRNFLVACSLDRPAVWVPRLNPGASGSGKVCFELEEFSKLPDTEKYSLDTKERESSTFFFVADNYGVGQYSSPYQKLFRWDPTFTYQVSEPARFRPAAVEDTASPTPMLALRFIATDKGGQLESVYLTSNQPTATDADPILIDSRKALPATIRFKGAEIEVMALENGVLAYRILNGFSTQTAYIMDLPG